VLCIYCDYHRPGEGTVSNLIASLLKQLVQERGILSEDIKSFYNRYYGRGALPTLDTYMTTLRSEIEAYSKVFIVVDALDECSEYDGTRADLLQALKHLARTVSLMVTSRPLGSIVRYFQEDKCLQIHANDQDVRKYVEARIPRERRLARQVKDYPVLKDTIVNKIVANVRGM
jgi:hypothetical protein